MPQDQLWHILRELRQAFETLYGDRLAQMLLYGSQARGDATPESDIDVLVVLQTVGDFDKEREQMMDIVVDLSLKYDVLVSAMLMPMERYRYGQGGLLTNVRREGILI
jgi:predicted nucleotidyltransferase